MLFKSITTSCLVAGLVFGCAAGALAKEKKAAKSDAAPEAAQVGAPTFAMSTNGPAKSAPFSSEMSAEFIKKVMETSKKIEEIKKETAARRAWLQENNPEVKAAYAKLVAMQKDINAILEQDAELTQLKMQRDILWTVMPHMPNMRAGAGMPMMGGPMMGGPRPMPVSK